MLFDSSIRKELARSFGATLVVLITVVMTMMLIRTLGLASRGSVAPTDVLLVMGFTVLGQLPTILSLSLFVAVVSVLSRMYRDSEMVIWFSAGQGLATLLAPLLRFAWPVMLAVGALALVAWPWANRQIQDLKTRYEQRADIDRIAPGQFQESAGGSRVFFIDKDSPDAMSANNVFIATMETKRETVTSAQSARLQIIEGERVAILSQGQRLESHPDSTSLRLSEFAEYGTRIGTASNIAPEEAAVKARDTLELLKNPLPIFHAELAWRFGLVLAVLNFVVLGIVLAVVNPRAGRSASLLLALFAFVIYYNLMTVGQSWIASERTSALAFMAALHGGTLVLALLLLTARHHQWSLLRLARSRSFASTAP